MSHSEAATLVTASILLPSEERARADMYALGARLLLAAPDAELLAALAAADSLPSQQADNPLERAWQKLLQGAGLTTKQQVQLEFDALFISTGNPRLNPNASLYLAGSMMDQPLAALRSDLARLGLARIAGVAELEDHLAALCEAMRLLISGEQGAEPQSLAVQKAFFEQHLAPWYARCLDDIRQAEDANFYRLIADYLQAFLDIEAAAFRLEEVCIAD